MVSISQVTRQTQNDLLLMESITIPLSVVFVWVFGGLLAAVLPIVVAVMAVADTLAILRLITFSTDVSVFALNLSTAMGLALAIDYTLLIVDHFFRDELALGATRHVALEHTMVTAGRTVLFSATTVALSMAALTLFPMHFLKSLAYPGVVTVAFAATVAVVVTPAALAVLGDRLDSLDVRGLARRLLVDRRRCLFPSSNGFGTAQRNSSCAVPFPCNWPGVTLLVLLGAPFLGVKWGFPSSRVATEVRARTPGGRPTAQQLRR